MSGIIGVSPDMRSGVVGVFPDGQVIQVQSTTLTTGYTAINSSFTDITGLSVVITPKFSNSKVLVLVSQVSNTFGYIYNSGAAFVETRSMNFLDSPATTSATTYKVQAGGSSSVFVNMSSTDTDAANFGRQVSTITVMEVAQ